MKNTHAALLLTKLRIQGDLFYTESCLISLRIIAPEILKVYFIHCIAIFPNEKFPE